MPPRKGWRKKLASSAASLPTGFDGPTCAFCGRPNSDDMVGELLSTDSLHAHYFCMLFSSSLPQDGPETGPLRGFEEDLVLAQLRKGQPCAFCKGKNATVVCSSKACKKVFHVACGLANGCVLQFFDQFRAFCPPHRPRQSVAPSDGVHDPCAICAEELVYPSVSVLVAPCCRHPFHRHCIQQQALSSGSHFFRCGHCNNQEAFQKEMQKHGIYIPEQDASWEQEPHAFEELLFRYHRCDAARCCCPEGREHSEQASRWQLAICDGCGSGGVHAGCANLALPVTHWLCASCRHVLGRGFKPSSEPLKTKSDGPRPSDKPATRSKPSLPKPLQSRPDDSEPPQEATSNAETRIAPPKCRCKVCGHGFPSLRLLHKHLHNKHTNYQKGKHRCPYCLFSSRHRAVILIHKRAHTYKKRFACKVCRRSFFLPSQLNFHLKRHTDDGSSKLARSSQSSGDQSSYCCDFKASGPPPGAGGARDVHQPLQMDISTKPHSCRLCNRRFSLPNHLGRHMRAQHRRRLSEPPEPCKLCSRKFFFLLHLGQRTKSLHARQLLTNVSKQPHPCQMCGRKFSFLRHLGQHIKSQHVMQPTDVCKQPCACRTCGRRFVSPGNLARHEESAHGRQPAPTGEPTHLSKAASPRFSFAGEAVFHEKAVLGKQCALTGKQTHPCGTCGQKFLYDSELALHEISEHGNQFPLNSEQAYLGETSSREFSFGSQFVLHEKLVNGRKYSFMSETTHSFETSSQEFSFDSQPVLHDESVNSSQYSLTGGTTDSFETSSQEFSLDSELASHEKLVNGSQSSLVSVTTDSCETSREFSSGSRPALPEKSVHATENERHESQMLHSCKVCGRKYLSSRQLVQHQKSVHSTQPTRASKTPHSCKICGQKFFSLFRLERHEKAHPSWEASNRRKLCDICGRRFLLACHLGRHKKLVHAVEGEVAGQQLHLDRQCDQSLSSTSQLSVHKMSAHSDLEDTSEMPFSCKVCGQKFPYACRLLVHERSHATKKPHPCTECGRSFLFPSQLKQHKKSAHDSSEDASETTLSCKVCGRKFPSAFRLLVHEKSHATKKPHPCTECGQSFLFPSQLKQHRKWAHDSSDVMGRPYLCTACGRNFLFPAQLKQHKKRAHGSSDVTRRRPYSCKICSRSFSLLRNVRKHEKEMHTKQKQKPSRHSQTFFSVLQLGQHTESVHDPLDTSKMPHSCKMCNQRFPLISFLEKHEKMAHPKLRAPKSKHPHLCRKCGEAFALASQLVRHKKLAHANVGTSKEHHWCDKCGKGFLRACYLAIHKKYSHNIKYVRKWHTKSAHANMGTSKEHHWCKKCGKRFLRACYLAIHKKFHHGIQCLRKRDQTYLCENCGRQFSSPSQLLMHEKQVHANLDARKQPYACKMCGGKFLLACHLASHVKYGHDEKWEPTRTQNVCKMCGVEFSFPSQLEVHEKSAHKQGRAVEMPHSCKTCGRKFLLLRHLLRHEKSKHPKQRVFTCSFEIRLPNLNRSKCTQAKCTTQPAAQPQQLESNKGLGEECERNSSAPSQVVYTE